MPPKAQRATAASDSSDAMPMASRRPMRCDSAPKNRPPIMAPTLYTTAMVETVPAAKPCCAPRNALGYRSCVPWLKKLKAVINTTA